MAKTAKLKANAKSKSLHSRSARRATSPSLNLDKSLKSLPRPDEDSRPPPTVPVTFHNAGISKKKARSKTQSRAKRMRLQKGLERAEAVIDRTETKVEKSRGREKATKDRSANWEDLNDKIKGVKTPKDTKMPKLKGEEMEEVELEGNDSKATDVLEGVDTPAEVVVGSTLLVVDRSLTKDNEDEIT